MSVTDKLGNELEVGSYIIYSSIGTIGEVLKTKTDENGSWVLIAIDELNKLWYNTKYVELTDKKYLRKTVDENDDKTELSVKDIKEKIKSSVSSEMSSDAVGGG